MSRKSVVADLRLELPCFLAAYIVVNAPYWVLAHWLFMSRPLFNVELVIPLLLSARYLGWAAAILVVAWGLDFAVGQALTYHFVPSISLLGASSYLPDLQLGAFFSAHVVLMVLPFLGAAVLAVWLMPHKHTPWSAAVVTTAVVCACDILNGSSAVAVRATELLPVNIANSPVLTLVVRSLESRRQPRISLVALNASDSAAGIADLRGWAAAHPRGSMILVLVESMGLHRDQRLRAWLESQLYVPALAQRYSLSASAVPFRGSTTFAELRELCGRYGDYHALDTASGRTCLPAQLLHEGWTTVGLHGFSSHMFDRAAWWPLTGLQQQRFAQDLAVVDAKRCGGAFAGICDATLIAAAVEEAQATRRFVYMLTLNSHLPLTPITVPPDLQQRCLSANVGDDVCRLTATLGVALSALQTSLLAYDTRPAVVVVGDHQPPFSLLSDRQQYDDAHVPAFILMPR